MNFCTSSDKARQQHRWRIEKTIHYHNYRYSKGKQDTLLLCLSGSHVTVPLMVLNFQKYLPDSPMDKNRKPRIASQTGLAANQTLLHVPINFLCFFKDSLARNTGGGATPLLLCTKHSPTHQRLHPPPCIHARTISTPPIACI